MKLSSALLRRFSTLHTWAGIIAGFALFVAFYAGAITVFHHDLPQWQSPDVIERPVQTIDDAQRLLDMTLARYPDARRHVGMLFPGGHYHEIAIYWQDAAGTWLFASLDAPDARAEPAGSELAELINELHYSLGLPLAGTWLMGVVSLMYGLALISGVVIFLPRLAKDLFALRAGRNLKQFWQDAHNVIGVLSLPMHLMFAITGALLCLVIGLMAALNPLIFDGRLMQELPAAFDTAPVREARSIAVPQPGTLAMWHARSIALAREAGLADFEPAYLKLANAGDVNAVVEITGESPGSLGPLGAVALDANTGEFLAMQLPGRRDANHATLASTYALHFGEYGNALVPWLYFVLGLGGAFLFYTGNLLWIEARRRRRAPQQGRAQVTLARATVGVCIGVCVAISAAFVAVQIAEALVPARVDAAIRWTCFLAWGGCVLWAAVRPPAAAARELLWAAAVVTAAIPVAHGAATGWWLWRSAAAGHGSLFWIDAIALAMAVAFAALAMAARRRARSGDRHSVWSDAVDRASFSAGDA